MKISIIKKESKADEDFHNKEWKIANLEHHGKIVNWSKKRFLLKASENRKTVGFLEFTIQAGVVHIRDLIIDHNKKRQGIGKKLMLKVEKIAKKNDAHKVYLTTGIGWDSEKFYEKLGYKRMGKLPKHYYCKDQIIFSKFI